MSKKLIYIAGPITSNPDTYYIKFLIVESFLTSLGYDVYNPARLKEGLDYKFYVDDGLKNLMRCDAICMLPDWTKSKGACLEHHYAETIGIPILYM